LAGWLDGGGWLELELERAVGRLFGVASMLRNARALGRLLIVPKERAVGVVVSSGAVRAAA